MNDAEPPRAGLRKWLTPSRNRWIAFAALVAAVLVGLRVVMPSVPREFDGRVSLRAWRDPPDVARRVVLTFERGGETVRSVEARFDRVPPREWRRQVSLPAGSYRATVRIETDARVVERESNVEIAPGATIELPSPER